MAYSNEMAVITPTATILAELVADIGSMTYGSGQAAFASVKRFSGSSQTALLLHLTSIRMPAAVVWHRRSVWGDKPRRFFEMSIFVIDKISSSWLDAEATVDAYVEDLADTFQRTILDSGALALYFDADTKIEIPDNPQLCVARIDFTVRDQSE